MSESSSGSRALFRVPRPTLAVWWNRWGAAALWGGVAIASLAASIRLSHGIVRLVSASDRRGGIDLRFRWHEVNAWFAGAPVYGRLETADYPPASYPMLWPFVGWMDLPAARVLWAAVTLALLLAFARILWLETRARPLAERWWLALLPMAGYAAHGALVTGQVVVLALVSLVAGVLLIVRGRTLSHDVSGAALIILALVKPTLTVPMVWIAFLVPGRLRPAALIVGGYALVTLFAASMQPAGVLELARGWLAQGDRVNLQATYGNLQKVIALAGQSDLFLPVALAVILATGAWVYRHRAVDVWILLGATAIVARLLTYHRSFDDLLIVLPVFALARMAADGDTPRRRIVAGSLAVALWAGMMTPRVLLAEISAGLTAINAALPLLWVLTLAYLAAEARRCRADDRQAVQRMSPPRAAAA